MYVRACDCASIFIINCIDLLGYIAVAESGGEKGKRTNYNGNCDCDNSTGRQDAAPLMHFVRCNKFDFMLFPHRGSRRRSVVRSVSVV